MAALCVAGLAAFPVGAQGVGATHSDPPVSSAPPAAGTRVYLSVDRDGHATFSDHAQPGAVSQQIRSYDFVPDTQARQRAQTEREYWRARSEAFAQRQQARERDREQAAALAARSRAERAPAWADLPVRRYYTLPSSVHPGWGAGPGGGPGGGAAGVGGGYQGGPGAASRAGAAFIGSGFAGAR